MSSGVSTDKEVYIVRTFDAPKKLVFQALADPERLVQWFAPQGCTIAYRSIDVRTGGGFHSVLHTPTGYVCMCMGKYLEVAPPDRIVFTFSRADDEGRAIAPDTVGMDPDWPAETIVTIDLVEVEGKTRLTLHQTVSEALAIKTGAHPSWLSMFDRLAELLSTDDPRTAA